jgi:betaine-aldehyde dehydrogenase
MSAFEAFVGGAAHPGGGPCDALLDPCTGEAWGEARRAGAAEVDAAVAAARASLPAWSARPVGERSTALLALAQLLEAHADELADLEVRSTGKPLAVVRDEEIPFAVDNLRFFAGAARAPEGRAGGEYLPGHTSFVRREAIGVVGQVCPWNYPLMMAVWKVGPALATGNAVVLKPAEQTPCTALRLAELALEAGLPAGVLNVVCGGRETGALIAGHAGVDMVAITGSLAAGREVARAASERVAQVHLELGGNAPVVVFADGVDDYALDAIAAAAYANAGQDCTAATRLLVERAVCEQVVAGLAERAGAHRTGDPRDPQTTLGPLISAAQQQRVSALVDGRAPSARLVAGGSAGGPGFHFQPTVIADVAQQDALVQEEIFGPVATVQPFDGEADALALANGTPFGLAASVWTRDVDRAMRLSRSLDFGCVWVNEHYWLCSEMPHGGFGASGYGKDLSPYALEEYSRVKHVMIRGQEKI